MGTQTPSDCKHRVEGEVLYHVRLNTYTAEEGRRKKKEGRSG
ncbi:MAG: hypothetical protein SWX82_25220 [Cyanobacteriota bacterium]|nr:hypothetical protein [Cyanobacteriota bacterium]